LTPSPFGRLLRCGLLAVASVGLAAVVGCNSLRGSVSDTPTPAPSGIRGTVILGPTCATGESPGAYEPVPCLTPYAAELVIIDRDNAVAARVSAGADGRFEVTLAPGEYVVTPQSSDSFPNAQPLPVEVTPGEYAEVQINYDTGIR
jgi:hypothetical protein